MTLKISSFAKPTLTAKPSAKEYNFERVFYEAGLKLKGDDKYSAYVKHIGTLFKNIQLVDPLAIMHTVDESGGAKPLGSKTEMSANMNVFWHTRRWGATRRHSNQRGTPTRRRDVMAKMSPTLLTPASTQRWFSHLMLNPMS